MNIAYVKYTGQKEVLKRTRLSSADYDGTVKEILTQVQNRGDAAVREYTERFDQVKLSELEVGQEEIQEAISRVGSRFMEILNRAKERIVEYHSMQKRNSLLKTEANGSMTGLLILPLERVGVYVPGGKALYPSSVLMNVLPAKVAGVGEVIMVSPPGPDGRLDDKILASASVCGVDRVFKMGGAQAIGALAYGTESVPRVDKIVGPGNIFVATAKKLVYGEVNVDSIAGPSEILVLADETANPQYVAADLLSQAEHDELAGAILITDSESLADAVKKELEVQTAAAPRRAIIEAALANRGMILLTQNLEEGIVLANEYAPEHMEICTREPMSLVPKIRNAGAIFVGNYSPEPMGDYMAGPNHVLPTGGTARFFSPLNVDDFIKKTSLLYMSRESLRKLGPDVVEFAQAEQLFAHGNAVKLRLEEMERE